MMAESVSMMEARGVGRMARLQIRLTQRQADFVQRRAAEHGVSRSQVIRNCVDGLIREYLLGMVGSFHGPPDLSERHDDYFVESIEEEWKTGERHGNDGENPSAVGEGPGGRP